MTPESVGNTPAVESGDRWQTVVVSLVVGTAFFALWFWLLPGWLGFRVETAGVARWRWLAALPSVLGFAVALRCVCGGMDWPVDRVRARQPDADRSRGSPHPRGTSVCDFRRRANAAWKVQRRLRELLPERQALVAATARLGQVLRRMLG
jgi:hypothetical protein